MDRLSIVRLIWRGVGVLVRMYSACRGIGWLLDQLQGPDE